MKVKKIPNEKTKESEKVILKKNKKSLKLFLKNLDIDIKNFFIFILTILCFVLLITNNTKHEKIIILETKVEDKTEEAKRNIDAFEKQIRENGSLDKKLRQCGGK